MSPQDPRRRAIDEACEEMDEKKRSREQNVIDARNSIKDFIYHVDVDTSLIDKSIRKKINQVIDRVHRDYNIQGNF